MGSPILAAVASIYKFWKEGHRELWLRYVGDVFLIWPYGKKKLEDFFQHFNNSHPNIKHSKEIKWNIISWTS